MNRRAFLSAAVAVPALALPAVESGLVDQLRWTAEEVAGAFGVPAEYLLPRRMTLRYLTDEHGVTRVWHRGKLLAHDPKAAA